MTEQPPESSPDDHSAPPPVSPFARPAGSSGEPEGGFGQVPGGDEPRFAGAPYTYDTAPQYGAPQYPTQQYQTQQFPPPQFPTQYPTQQLPQFPPPDYPSAGWPVPAGYQPPDAWGTPPSTPPPPRKTPRIIAAVLVIALIIGGTTTALLVSGGSKDQAATPIPQTSTNPAPTAGPTPGSSPTPDPNSGLPLPTTGITTPPGLLAIGYHAYSLGLRDPSEISLGAGEDAQFKKYGLSQVVGLRALTIGKAGVTSDDYDADINILKFRDAAGAKAELAYSNAENKKSAGAKTIALPGFPDVTAFLNDDATDGLSIGAFTTVGRYQVVLVLGGLTPNVVTDSKALAKETARVLKALLPDAASIQPDTAGGGTGGSGGGGGTPVLPSPTPSGVRA